MKAFSFKNHVAVVAAGWLLALWSAQGFAQAPGCGGPGTPCASGDGSSQPAPTGQTGVGNPIDLVTGNKYLREADVDWSGELAISVVRHYNSQSRFGRVLGPGWSHTYEAVLTRFNGDGAKRAPEIQLVQGDGRRITFRPVGPVQHGVQQYHAIPAGYGIIEENQREIQRLRAGAAPHQTPWIWRWQGGRHLEFDGHGLVAAIGNAEGDRLRLTYDASGRVTTATDAHRRRLVFEYWDNAAERLLPFDRPSRDAATGRPGFLKSVRLPDGAQIRYSYDANGMLSRVEFPDATAIQYRYAEHAGAWRLTEVIGRDGKARGYYSYDESGRAVASTLPGGAHAVKLEYQLPEDKDAAGRTLVTNSRGDVSVYRWRYLEATNESRIIEAIGPGCTLCPPTNARYHYDARGRIARIERLAEGADAPQEQLRRVSTAASAAGPTLRAGRVLEAQRFEYDSHDRLLSIHRNVAGNEQLVERRHYADENPLAGPVRIEQASVAARQLHAMEIRYNRRGQPVEVIERGYSPRWLSGGRSEFLPIERRHALSYYESADGTQAPVGKLKAIDGPLAGSADRVEFGYTDARLLAQVKYPEQLSDQYTYDALGRLIARVAEDGVAEQFAYAEPRERYLARPFPNVHTRGSLATRVTLQPDARIDEYSSASGQRIKLAYDDAGRLTKLTDAQGHATQFAYDTEGNRTALIRSGRAAQGTHDIQQTLRVAYDAYRRITAVISGPDATTHFGYGDTGTLQTIASNEEGVARAEADSAGRMVRLVRTSSGEAASEYRFAIATAFELDWDSVQDAAESDSTNEETASLHAGRRLADFAHVLVARDWDNAFPLRGAHAQSIGGPNQEASVYLQDDFGRVVREDSNDAGWANYLYDAGDDPVQVCRANGGCDLLKYDALGRSVERIARDARGREQATRLRYAGNYLVEISHPNQTTRYSHDDHGRLILREDALAVGTYRWSWRFDERGRLQERGMPDGTTLHVQYAEASPYPVAVELEEVNGERRRLLRDIRFTPVEGIASFEYGNGVKKTLTHDRFGRLTAVTFSKTAQQPSSILAALIPNAQASAGEVIWRSELTHDAANRVSSIGDGTAPAALQYDADGRMAALDSQRGRTAFEYDAAGNLLATVRNQKISERNSYAPFSNRLAAANGSAVSHDASGNVTAVDGMTLTYGPDDRVESIRTAQGSTETYLYNAFGERIAARTDGGATRYFLYDDSRLTAEVGADGAVEATYVYLGDEPVAKVERDRQQGWFSRTVQRVSTWFAPDARISFIHGDHIGTPQFATDGEQQTVWRASYDPYGRAVVDPAAGIELNLRFAGQYYDAATKLHYNYQRYYAPQLGRYLQPDPLGLAGGLNRYQYAEANPLAMTDPRGESIISWLGKRAGMRVVQHEIRRYLREFAQTRIARIVRRWADRGMNVADQFEEVTEILRILDGASGIGVWDVVGLIPVIGDAVDIGRTARQLCRIKDLLKRLDRKLLGFDRLPVNGGRWAAGRPGNGSWLPDRDSPAWRATGGRPIAYRDGFPDFTPFTHVDARGRRAQVNIQLSGDSAADIREAQRRMRQQYPDWVEPPNHTWHHDTQCGRMILVATVINSIPHAGGDAIHRQGLCN